MSTSITTGSAMLNSLAACSATATRANSPIGSASTTQLTPTRLAAPRDSEHVAMFPTRRNDARFALTTTAFFNASGGADPYKEKDAVFRAELNLQLLYQILSSRVTLNRVDALESYFMEELRCQPSDQLRMSAVLGLSHLGTGKAYDALNALRRLEPNTILQMAIDNALSRMEFRHGKVHSSPHDRGFCGVVMARSNEMTNAESIQAFKDLRCLAQQRRVSDEDAEQLETHLLSLLDHDGRTSPDKEGVWQETAQGMRILAPSRECYAMMILEEIGSERTLGHLENWSRGVGRDAFLMRLFKNDILFHLKQHLAFKKALSWFPEKR